MAPKTLTLVDGVDGGIAALSIGKILYVDGVRGSDTGSGVMCQTIQGAVNKANPGDTIIIKPARYAENVVIPVSRPYLRLISAGTRHTADIVPEDGGPLTIDADDVELVGFDLEAPDGELAAIITGDRFRALRTKFEGGDFAVRIGPRTVAAGGHGGADALLDDCEFAWSDQGVQLYGSDYGAATEIRIRKSRFHNLATAHLCEGHRAGGANFDHYRNLLVEDCTFGRDEDGVAPTKFVDLNDSNANSGLITGCGIDHATNAAAVLALSTALRWVANRTEAGTSAARPA